jgi:hypothetical protein
MFASGRRHHDSGEGDAVLSWPMPAPPTTFAATEPGQPFIQRDAPADSAPEPGPPAALPAAVQPTAASGPAPSPAGAPTAGGATDIDELAHRLFEPLSTRLRAELWLDRERAGLITDPRR